MKEVFIFLLALAILHHFYGAVQHQYAGRATLNAPTTTTASEQPSPVAFNGDTAAISAAIYAVKPIATGQVVRKGKVVGTKVTDDDRDRANQQKVAIAAPLIYAALGECPEPIPAGALAGLWGQESTYCAGLPAERCAVSSAAAVGPTQHKRTKNGEWAFGKPGENPEMLYDAFKMSVRHLCNARRADNNGTIVPSSDIALMRYHGENSYANPSEYVKGIRAKQARHETILAAARSGNGPVIVSNAGMTMPTLAAPVNRNGFMPMIGHPEKTLRTAIAVDGTPTAYPIAIGEGYLASLMGSHRDDPRGGHAHGGNDIAADENVLIVAAADGVVQYAAWHHDLDKKGKPGPGEAAGLHVLIEHNIGSKKLYQLATSSYMHCKKALVSVGQHVQRGEPIALVGKTAVEKSGAHLHFQAMRWDENGERVIADLDKYFDSSRHDPLNTPVYAGPVNEGSKAAAQKFATLAMSH